MQRILRFLAPLALLVASLALVACGGDDKSTGGTAVNGEDPQAILEQTFGGDGDKKVDSGNIDLTMTINASGGDTSLEGPVNVSLSGPFQSEGEKQVPKFDLDVAFEGAGQNIEAGATSTGEKGFINFNGQEYAVSDEVFQQFTAGFEQAAEQQSGDETTFEQLGISPQTWLKDATNEGDSTVGDTTTIKITGQVDLPKMLDDVNQLLSQAGSLGIPDTGQLPTELTDEQIQQVEDSVKDASVEIETGKDDSILRRMAFTLSLEDPEGSGGSADIDFDLSLTGLNEDQDISEPEDTKPLDDLLGQFGGLGALGALGGASSGGAGTTPNSDAAAAYTDCVTEAAGDVQAAQECTALLTP